MPATPALERMLYRRFDRVLHSTQYRATVCVCYVTQKLVQGGYDPENASPCLEAGS